MSDAHADGLRSHVSQTDYRPHIGWHDYSQAQREQDEINKRREERDVIEDESEWLGLPHGTHTNRGSW